MQRSYPSIGSLYHPCTQFHLKSITLRYNPAFIIFSIPASAGMTNTQ